MLDEQTGGTSDVIDTLQRRDPRYQIKQDDGVTVTIAATDDSCESIEVKLLDISITGAKIRTRRRMGAKDVVALKIESEHPPREVTVAGEVCWVNPAAGDDWSIGCRFEPPLPESLLHEFAAAQILERRAHDRVATALRATAMWELQGGSNPVSIEDYSKGGFCLRSQVDGKPGERTLLRLELGDRELAVVRGKIKWQIRSHNEFVIGCEFVVSQDFHVLCNVIDAVGQANVASQVPMARSVRQVSPVCAAGVAVLLGTFSLGGAVDEPGRVTHVNSNEVSAAATCETRCPIAESPRPDPAATAAVRSTTGPTSPPGVPPSPLEPASTTNGSRGIEPQTEQMVTSRTVFPTAAAEDGTDESTSRSDRAAFRTWTDDTGTYRVLARLESVNASSIRLEKKSGGFATVPLNRLSEGDVRYVRRSSRRSDPALPR